MQMYIAYSTSSNMIDVFLLKAFALQLKLEPHSGAFGMPMWVPLIATSPLPCLKETLGGVSLLALCQVKFSLIFFTF
jgi:hypothetical protein